MAIRTGEQYIEGLRKRNPEIWIGGRKVTDVVNEDVFVNQLYKLRTYMICSTIQNIKIRLLIYAKRQEKGYQMHFSTEKL